MTNAPTARNHTIGYPSGCCASVHTGGATWRRTVVHLRTPLLATEVGRTGCALCPHSWWCWPPWSPSSGSRWPGKVWPGLPQRGSWQGATWALAHAVRPLPTHAIREASMMARPKAGSVSTTLFRKQRCSSSIRSHSAMGFNCPECTSMEHSSRVPIWLAPISKGQISPEPTSTILP